MCFKKQFLNFAKFESEGAPTILLDMPTCFVIGQLLMLFASREVERSKNFWTKPLLLALAYGAFVFVPVTGWYFYAHMGWSTVYLRSEELIPVWAGPLILCLYFLGLFFGASLAQAMIQCRQKKFVRLTLFGGFFWLFSIAALTSDEYAHIGSFSEYHGGLAPSIFATPSFMTELNLMGAILILPAIVLAFYLRMQSSSKSLNSP